MNTEARGQRPETRNQKPEARRVGANGHSSLLLALLLSLFVWLLASGFFPHSAHSAQSTLQDQFNQANTAYFNRDFDKAIQLYADLEKRGVMSGDLFYNLANTYYRQGKVGWAVYYYLKALRYHPRDRDLEANYRYVAGKRVDQIEEPLLSKLYHAAFFWVDLTTCKELLLISVGVYWLFFILLALRLTRKKFILTLAVITVGGLNAILLPSALAKYYSERIQKTGVIVSPVSAVYSEPAQGAIKLFDLHEGAVATVTDEANGFEKIRLADGKRGWVAENDLRKIQ